MAFNPFTNFRKYRTFWMATILLLCMVTFVLCMGFGQGDLSDLLLKIFRSRGTAWAKLDGSSVYSQEFYDLKERRNAANEFMRDASKICMARMDEVLKPENIKKAEKNPKDQEAIVRVQQLRNRLEALNRQPRFFDSGVKAEDLLDFKIWLAEADRLGIYLNNEAVMLLIRYELVLGSPEFYTMEIFRAAAFEVRRNYQRATEAMITDTLRDEFRARLAQRVLAVAGGTRIALTPAQIWDVYKEKRVEYRISLLPLHVEDFVRDVKTPDDETLRIFFEQYKIKAYDPASPDPGFAIPGRVKAAMISGDPNSEYFKKLSKLALDLQTLPPLPGPQYASWQLVGAQLAKSAAAQQMFDNVRNRYMIEGLFEPYANLSVAWHLGRKDPSSVAALISAGARSDAIFAALPNFWGTAMLRNHKEFQAGTQEILKKRAPFFASLTMLGSTHQGLAIPLVWDDFRFQVDYLPLSVVQDELLEFVQRRQGRIWVQSHMQALKKKLEEPNIRTRAAVDDAIRTYLEAPYLDKNRKPKPNYPKDDKGNLKILTLKDIGLELAETKDFYDKYRIPDAKELEPLRKAYLANFPEINIIEGRNITPERVLKSDDFWKLFFSEAGESFSATSKYQVKPWPPTVTILPQRVQQARLMPQNQRDLEIAQLAANTGANEPVVMQMFNDAERPILFWRTDSESGGVAKDWKEVRDQVIAAWKLEKARENIVLPRAQKIAETVQKSGAPTLTMQAALEDLKNEFDVKREIIPLGSGMEPVAPLVPARGGDFRGGEVRIYHEFTLPAGTISYPRKDTAAQLLGLYDLKAPIDVGYKRLYDVNNSLYKEISKDKNPKGKFVQVLTNQPRNAFYVTVVKDAPEPSHMDFNMTVREASGHDKFFDQAVTDAGKKMREELMKQLRDAHKLDPPGEEVRKSFDHDATN